MVGMTFFLEKQKRNYKFWAGPGIIQLVINYISSNNYIMKKDIFEAINFSIFQEGHTVLIYKKFSTKLSDKISIFPIYDYIFQQ